VNGGAVVASDFSAKLVWASGQASRSIDGTDQNKGHQRPAAMDDGGLPPTSSSRPAVVAISCCLRRQLA